MSTFIKTKLATDWEAPNDKWGQRIASFIFKFVDSNPDYTPNFHRISEWIIEFPEDNEPWREIALDEKEIVVLAGPSERNYGFWCDTNCTLEDFDNIQSSPEYFERKWKEYWKNKDDKPLT